MHKGPGATGDRNRVAEFRAARARFGVALVVTGSMAPHSEGGVFPGAAGLFTPQDVARHRIVTGRVRDAGGRIAMQTLHAGRQAFGKGCVAPGAARSPVLPFAPPRLDAAGIGAQIATIITAAARAQDAGPDGVGVMGCFPKRFPLRHTNRRTDRQGGACGNRMRLPALVMRRVRQAVGPQFIVICRISLIGAVADVSTRDKVALLAQAVAAAGAADEAAPRMPGKKEFQRLVARFVTMVAKAGINLRLGHKATVDDLRGFAALVTATGVPPRDPGIPGQDGPDVPGCAEVLRAAPVGWRVAVAGTGGIGFVVAAALVHQGTSPALWCREWGVGNPATSPGGLAGSGPQPGPPAQGYAVARESGKAGAAAGQDDRLDSPRQTAGQGCGDAGGNGLPPPCSQRAGGDRGCLTAPQSRRYGGALHRAGSPADPCRGTRDGGACLSRHRRGRPGGRA